MIWSWSTLTVEAFPLPVLILLTFHKSLQLLQTTSHRGTRHSPSNRPQEHEQVLELETEPVLVWTVWVCFAGVSLCRWTSTCISVTTRPAVTSTSSGRRDERGNATSTTTSRGSRWSSSSTYSGSACVLWVLRSNGVVLLKSHTLC